MAGAIVLRGGSASVGKTRLATGAGGLLQCRKDVHLDDVRHAQVARAIPATWARGSDCRRANLRGIERDELRLKFQEYVSTRDPALRDELISAHMHLAEHLARRFAHPGELHDDLVQVASVGLSKAVDRFDPQRDLAFSSYATPSIIGELKRHFRDKAWALRLRRGRLE